jgi:hypothetical protein
LLVLLVVQAVHALHPSASSFWIGLYTATMAIVVFHVLEFGEALPVLTTPSGAAPTR